MIVKRRPPYMLYGISLIFLLAIGYFISGLYTISGVNLGNLQENLTYIVTHPSLKYWNEKSMAFMGLGFVAWIMFISWYSSHNRNFHFGVEHGSAEWGDVKKIGKELADKNNTKNTIISYNLKIGETALSNNNMVVIGASGSFKTSSIVGPNILLGNTSMIILDVKGELLRRYGNYLKSIGFHIASFNLVEPWKSDRYNPFVYVERETDLIRLITNLHESVKKPDSMQGDPFWDDGVDLYLQAMFFYEWLQAKEEKRSGSMNNILGLVNDESKLIDKDTTVLQQKMNVLAQKKGDDYPPVRDYRKLKDGAPETVRSIIIMVNAMLRLCETADIKRVFSGNDINIESIGMGVGGNPNRKTALFLVLPDNDHSYNFLISMFYTQAFDVLMRAADNKVKGALPIHVRFWMDEFYTGAKPSNPDGLLGVVRGRNISMVPILQSPAQLKVLFKNDKWETIWDNAPCVIFLGAGAMATGTHEWVSKALAKATIDTRTDGESLGRNGNVSNNFQSTGRELMTPDEVRRMRRDECIVFLEGQNPIFDRKPIPFKHKRVRQVYKMKEFEKALKCEDYEHPVRTIYNEDTFEYRTIRTKEAFQELTKEEISFYEEAAKNDKSIKIFNVEEKDVLYLNWDCKPQLTETEVAALYQSTIKRELADIPPEDVVMKAEMDERTEIRYKVKWNMSGSIIECLKRHAKDLTEGQINQILMGIEDGLTDRQIKAYFSLPEREQEYFRRAYTAKRNS